jgi:hypothetical protein
MIRCSFRLSTHVAALLFLTQPALPQVTGRSPALNGVTPFSADLPSYTFAINNGVGCPTPSFAIGFYGGSGNDWANDYSTYDSVSSGINNFGGAVGLRIPLGGKEYSKYCREYAKSLADKTSDDMLAQRRNYQLSLLQQCHWLKLNLVNLDQPAFMKDGIFSELSVCEGYSAKQAPGVRGDPEKFEPPKADIPQLPPSNLVFPRAN